MKAGNSHKESLRPRHWFPLRGIFVVRSPLAGKKNFPRKTLHALLILAVSAVLDTLNISAETADFFLVENPRALRLLDKYEQPLDATRKSDLLQFTPFQILHERGTLGDQITPATKFEYLGQTLYLPKTDNGAFYGSSQAGLSKTLRGCELIGDTIVVQRDNTIQLLAGVAPGAKSVYLKSGQQCFRVFRQGDYSYIRINSPQAAYGWARLSAGSSWKKFSLQQPALPDTLSAETRERIRVRLDSANVLYTRYFEYFNRSATRQYDPPQWRCRESSDGMTCESYPSAHKGLLPSSSRMLADDIDQLLLMTSFSARYRDGRIEVVRRKQGAR